MKRRLTMKVLLIASFLLALSGFGSVAPVQAQQQERQALTIRYIWFSATPKPGVQVDPYRLPAVFGALQYGWSVALTDTPEGFLAKLRHMEPRFTYRLHLAGKAVPTGVDMYRIAGGPRKGDLLQHAAEEAIRVIKWESPTLLRTQRVGKLRQLSERWTGTEGSGWDDTMHPEGNKQVLGRTQSMGIDVRPSGKLSIYAVCFSKEALVPATKLAPH